MSNGIKKLSKRFNIVSLTDWHVPFENKEAISTAFQFCKKIKPEIIIIHEAHDFYSLSKFDKDPRRRYELQEEIDGVNNYFKILRKYCPNARIILLSSNHLDRLKRFLWSRASELAGLRNLRIKNLLELSKNKIEFKDYFVFRGFLFKHGDIVRQDSAYTAKAEYIREGMSGASGHTHRLSQYFTTKRGGSYTWIESGCLCTLRPEWISGTANWQNGISLVSFDGKTSRFDARPIPIIDNKIII